MADVYVNALTTIATEPTSTDSIVCVNRNTNEGQIIDYSLFRGKILDRLTEKTFSSTLNTTSKTVIGAINELDSDISSLNSSFANQLGNVKIEIGSIAQGDNMTFSATQAYMIIGGSNANNAIFQFRNGNVITHTSIGTAITASASGTTYTVNNGTTAATRYLLITV